jgi:hypothetical protein
MHLDYICAGQTERAKKSSIKILKTSSSASSNYSSASFSSVSTLILKSEMVYKVMRDVESVSLQFAVN